MKLALSSKKGHRWLSWIGPQKKKKKHWNLLIIRDNLVARFWASLGVPQHDGSDWGGEPLERRLTRVKLTESNRDTFGGSHPQATLPQIGKPLGRRKTGFMPR
jgi:hypothetical protein